MSNTTYKRGGYRRPVPPLPDPETLTFPNNLIRQCSKCALRAGCKAPVPGDGLIPGDLMFVGQNPGYNEDEYGKPFIGQSGQYLDSLLFQSGISRSDCYITNLVKCRTPNNRELHQPEIAACSPWLDLELASVQPRIIVAMGKPAILHFLGSTAGTLTVEHLHGKPVEQDGYIILPCYHPAAALRDTGTMRHVQEDFNVLRGLVKGTPPSSYIVRDEFPNPDYKVLDTVPAVMQAIDGAEEVAVDTEVCRGKLWSAQFSAEPGTAYFVPLPDDFTGRIDLTTYPATAIVHNYLFDIKYLNMRDDNAFDTMVLAYLLGLPQGLKELASRLCGINMVNYDEIVRPGQRKISTDYLKYAEKGDWPDPPPITETKWDNKAGELLTKNKKPWHISRKITKILSESEGNTDLDLFKRWKDIPDLERSMVEQKLGAMPEASLADIKFEDAVQYSSRDADATIRVYRALRKLITEMELDFVLQMDTAILPMVHSMMENGMPVDLTHLRTLSEDYDVQMRVKSAELAGLVGHSFNPNSSNQVAAVIYGELGFTPTKFTPTKEISTDDQELKKTESPVAKGIIQYRGIQKLKSTYADALIEQAIPDNIGVPRIHTTLKTTRVATGRLSSSDPNLQNIPTRSKQAKEIKNAFIAAPGKRLAEGDLAQIEVCTQAHLARCRGLINLFLSGKDPHTTTAANIFGVPYEEAKQEKYRYPTKRANFGVIYMIGAEGLSAQIGEYIADLKMAGEKVEVEPWSVETCQKFIDDWYKLYPEVRDYQQEMAAMARRYGYVRDMFGRIRYIPEVSCPIRAIQEAGLRQAANMPVTCLPVDTCVTTRSGWMPIGEFQDGMEVWTGEKWATATKHFMGVNPRVRVYLSDGRTFDCDSGHNLLVQVGPWPEWKNVLAIEPDEVLAQDWSMDWGQAVGEVEDWFWAGRFIGDGWLSGSKAKLRCWSMAFGHNDTEVADGERMVRWLATKQLGGRNHATSPGYHYDRFDRSNNGNFRIRGATKTGYNLWVSLGMEQKRAKEKRIPPIVFTLDQDRRRAFLDGYTSADGHTDHRRWMITSASRRLLEDTVRLAESLGHSARIDNGKTRIYWNDKPSTLYSCNILVNRRGLTIVKTEILQPEPMYTLSVDDDRHAFASEGLISKNSSAQGIIKIAMANLWNGLPSTPWANDVRWLMQIHDSLVMEITDTDEIVKPFLRWMLNVVTTGVSLLVPVRMDFKVGYKWGALEKVSLEDKVK